MDTWKQFEENNITHSAAHHILAVHELRKDRGYARVTDVAKLLNITTGSASTNLKSLKQKGLVVEDDNRFLTLSEHGENLAKAVLARKEIFMKFLTDVLHVTGDQAEIDSCKTEHLLSHETSGKLMAFMQLLSRKGKKEGKSLSTTIFGKDIDLSCCPLSNSVGKKISDCSICEDRCLLDEC